LLPAHLAWSRLTNLRKEFLDELAGLHFVQLLDANAEELLRQVFRLWLRELILVDDTQDEPALSLRAVPAITSRFERSPVTVTVTVAVHWIGASVWHNMETMTAVAAIGSSIFRHKTGMLDLLINRLLEQTVKPGDFSLCLGDVGEFSFDGGGEAVTDVLRQTELI